MIGRREKDAGEERSFGLCTCTDWPPLVPFKSMFGFFLFVKQRY